MHAYTLGAYVRGRAQTTEQTGHLCTREQRVRRKNFISDLQRAQQGLCRRGMDIQLEGMQRSIEK